jgi:hypothetical protein
MRRRAAVQEEEQEDDEEEEKPKILIDNKYVTLTSKETEERERKKQLQKNKWNYTYEFPQPSRFSILRNIDKWALDWILHDHSVARRHTTVAIENGKEIRNELYKQRDAIQMELNKCKSKWLLSLRPHFKNLIKNGYDVDKLPPSSIFNGDPKLIKNELKELITSLQLIQEQIEDVSMEIITNERERAAHHGVICAKIDNSILRERIKRTEGLNSDAMFRTYEQNEKMVNDFVKTLAVTTAAQYTKEKKIANKTIANGFNQLHEGGASSKLSMDDELKHMLKELIEGDKKKENVKEEEEEEEHISEKVLLSY